MLGVTCGPERYPVEQASLRYWHDAGVWVYECVGGEFVIRGGPDGPDPVRFDVSQRVAAHIDAFVAEANRYLEAFVVPERFKAFGPWEFQAAEFGQMGEERFRKFRSGLRYSGDPVDLFEIILFLGDDIYGLWGVRFGCSPMFGGLGSQLDRFYAHGFRRLQE